MATDRRIYVPVRVVLVHRTPVDVRARPEQIPNDSNERRPFAPIIGRDVGVLITPQLPSWPCDGVRDRRDTSGRCPIQYPRVSGTCVYTNDHPTAARELVSPVPPVTAGRLGPVLRVP